MINSERELLDMTVALREENRALKALIREVVNDVKRTVHIETSPTLTSELFTYTSGLWDCKLQRETIAKLLKLGGDDVRFGGSRTAQSRDGAQETTSQTKNAVRKRK